MQAAGTVNDSGGNITVVEYAGGSVNDSNGNITIFSIFGGTVNDSGGNITINDITIQPELTKQEAAVVSGGGGGAAAGGQLGFNFTFKKANITEIIAIPLELPENFWLALNTPINIPIPLPDGEYTLQVKPIALIALFFLLFVVVIIVRFMRQKHAY